MFSEACVILFTIGLMATRVTAHPSYSAVGMHPTGMFFVFFYFYFSKTNGNDEQ